MKKKKITRGKVAKAFGIAKNTLRNYEKLLLLKPEKGDNNYRYFTYEDISQLCGVLRMRELGWSLQEIYHLTNECDLKAFSGEIENHIERLLYEQQELLKKVNRLVHYNSNVNKAIYGSTHEYEVLAHGPTILWEPLPLDNEYQSGFLSHMNSACISGYMLFNAGEIDVETGFCVIKDANWDKNLILPQQVRTIETGHCIHGIRPCKIIEGKYLQEDYDPIFEYAIEKGFEPTNKLITYGLVRVQEESIPAYYIEMWLPLKN